MQEKAQKSPAADAAGLGVFSLACERHLQQLSVISPRNYHRRFCGDGRC
jgi:hypothetical protein